MIECRERYTQFINFGGIKYGSARPSDLDGYIEVNDTAFVFIETKYNGKDMPLGQQIGLERMAAAIAESGRESLVIVAEHFVKDVTQEVILADCSVRCFWWRGRWHKPSKTEDVKTLVNEFIAWALESKKQAEGTPSAC